MIETGWVSVRVSKEELAAEGIMSFELRPLNGNSLPGFTAGSHIDVELPNGMVRQYSLCNPPVERDRYEIGVLREAQGRGGSACAHRELKAGTMLRISRPRNHFALAPAARSILIAGGIGVTPLLSMAEQLALINAAFELHYCTRSLTRTAFVHRIRSSRYADKSAFHFDDGEPAQRFDARAALAAPAESTHLYVCGPQGFMDHVIGTAKALGWSSSNIHFEYFSAAKVDASVDARFEVELARSGQVVPVEVGQSVVQALAAHGVQVPVSCEQGVCGTCVMRVVQGEPEHRDMFLSEAERAANDRFTPCCSRSKSSRLVIDY